MWPFSKSDVFASNIKKYELIDRKRDGYKEKKGDREYKIETEWEKERESHRETESDSMKKGERG